MKLNITSNPTDVTEDRVSINDVKKYELDLAPWLVDKGTVSSIVWKVESGNGPGIATPTEESTLITFSQSGKSLISILVTTSTGEQKKIWLKVRAMDRNQYVDDYGMNHG